MPTRRFTRRTLLKGGAALPFAAGLAACRREPHSAEAAKPEPGAVRNIVFMVSDGMSAGVPSLAEPFSRLVRGRGTHWRTLAGAPETARGFLRTDSLSSMVTDSSAASSAWGSGSRIFNGAVNVLPDGTPLTPIATLARSAGRAVGLVTTTTLTHATPAGFAAVHPQRDAEAQIAPQYLEHVDVGLGGGLAFFAPGGSGDLLGRYRQRGFRICLRRDDLLDAGAAPNLLGLFSPGHMPYRIDQMQAPRQYAAVPTLAEMTRVALGSLAAQGRGFLLQVEGGRVDHAAHANDAASLLWEQLDFDDAIGEVLEFTRREPDTLVVITTDHGNANPGLNGVGRAYASSTQCFERLARVRGSFAMILAVLRRLGGWQGIVAADDVIDVLRVFTGATITRAEAEAIGRVLVGHRTADLNAQHRAIVGTLGQILGNVTGIGWTGTEHTADLGVTLAVGPGRERFAGVMDHSDVYRVLTDFLGVEHANPSMTEAQAKRFMPPPEPEGTPHWLEEREDAIGGVREGSAEAAK